MTLSTSGYTVGSNQPLNRARILWQPLTGTVTGDGTTPALAANDFTFQRWSAAAGMSRWTVTAASTVALDTFFIAAHNLRGKSRLRAMIGAATRTNLVLRSQEFDDAVWSKPGITITANAGFAPDGTLTAEKIIPTAADSAHLALQSITSVTSGVSYALSCYLKADGYGFARINLDGSFPSNWLFINLTTGAVGLNSGFTGITVVGVGGGWWRLSGTLVASATGATQVAVFALKDNSFTTFAGDGTSGILAWGAQLEVGTSATSYIPTTSATVASDLHAVSPWIVSDDNSAIAIMTNNAGVPWQTTKAAVEIPNGTGVQIGIIRAGVAMQMEQPVFGGVQPIGLNRMVETRHAISETGQWLGRTVQRQASSTEMNWTHLESAWYRSHFQPFALTLPQKPFGLIQNAQRMPESVAWCWTNAAPQPENMGVRDFMAVSLSVTGFMDA